MYSDPRPPPPPDPVRHHSDPAAVGFRQYPLDLTDVAHRLRDRLPLSPSELADIVPELALAGEPSPCRALQDAFRSAGLPPPFRLVGRNEKIAVPTTATALARAVFENASRQVLAWGLTEVSEVLTRVVAIGESTGSDAIVERLLGALPRLRWLDDRKRWFSFVEERSALGKAIERVFAVVDSIHIVELAMALSKISPSVRRASPSILARYLTEIADCRLVNNQVRASASAGRTTLPADEQTLVDLLQRRGGTADFAELDRLIPDSTQARALKRLTARSPLFLKTARGRLRLIGHGAAVVGSSWT